jgi:hypothetical protein
MADNGTKELARQMALMVEVPAVKAEIKRVADSLGAFKQVKSGHVVRNEALKQGTPSRSGSNQRNS